MADPLDSLSDDDLKHLSEGNLEALSDDALKIVAAGGEMHDAPAEPRPGLAATFGRELAGIKTDPQGLPERTAAFLGRNAGPLATGIIAQPAITAAALASGPFAASTEAALTGAATSLGRVAQTGFQNIGAVLGSGAPVRQPNLTDAAIEGLGAAAGSRVFSALGEALAPVAAKAKGALVRGGAQVLRNAAGVPETKGAAALEDLTLLNRAPSREQVSEAYDAFHTATGTTSRKEAVAASDDPFDTVQRGMTDLKDAYNKLKNGDLTIQEAINASQAGRVIRDAKRRGNEFAREIADTADDLKHQLDDWIEAQYPEWAKARTMAFQRNVADEFSTAFPLNINKSSNQLRGYGSLGMAGVGLATGNVPLALAPLAQSPMVLGAGIRLAGGLQSAAEAAGVKQLLKTGGSVAIGGDALSRAHSPENAAEFGLAPR